MGRWPDSRRQFNKSPSANREIGGPRKNKRMTVNLDAPKPGRHVTCKMQVMLL